MEDITSVVRSNEQVVFSPSIAPLLSSTCVLHSLILTQNQPKRAISPEEQSAPADRWQAGDITLGGYNHRSETRPDESWSLLSSSHIALLADCNPRIALEQLFCSSSGHSLAIHFADRLSSRE